jgi:hypothetical protein
MPLLAVMPSCFQTAYTETACGLADTTSAGHGPWALPTLRVMLRISVAAAVTRFIMCFGTRSQQGVGG